MILRAALEAALTNPTTPKGAMSTDKSTAVTEHSAATKKALDVLADLGGHRVADDAIKQEGTSLVLPTTMGPRDAILFLKEHIKAQEEVTAYTKVFDYRPEDVAAALMRAAKTAFGTAGIGRPTYTFFGKNPPEMRAVTINAKGDTIDVPAGEIEFSTVDGTAYVGSVRDPEKGIVGTITVEAPKKWGAVINGLWVLVQQELDKESIYRGKAITASSTPNFVDPYSVNREHIVLSTSAETSIFANIVTPIRHAEEMRRLGRSLKSAHINEGPYGTGKTSVLAVVAQEAIENGWTAVHVRPGRDSLEDGMQLARQYQPAVLLVEDVDNFADTADGDAVSELLDLFDGISAKGTELMIVMTTNHIEKVHRGMLRPGRVDSVNHIGTLDGTAALRLIKQALREQLNDLTEDEETQIQEALEGFLPAFIKEAAERAGRYAIARAMSDPDEHAVVTSDDVIAAADSLRSQQDLYENAGEGTVDESLATALGHVIKSSLLGTAMIPAQYEEHLAEGRHTLAELNGLAVVEAPQS